MNGRKPTLCPHEVLGIKKCKRCASEYQIKWQATAYGAEWVRKYRRSSKSKAQKRAYARRKSGMQDMGGETRKGKCPICKKIKQLVPDHNHDTGKFRDWTCGPCNRALGFFEKKNAKEFISYLEKHNG